VGSDSRSPTARHRFGFSGPLTREKNDRVTADDILASLTRQAELSQKLGEKDRLALGQIADAKDLSRFQGFNPEPELPSMVEENGRLGYLLFVSMLLSGLTVVWLYSSISKPFDLASLNRIIQKSGIQSIFGNLAQLGIIALTALAGAFWIRRKRAGSRPQLFSA